MTVNVLIALLVPLAGVIGYGLNYRATRQRDAPTIAVEQARLKLDDSRAALEAYVELAATMRSELVDLRANEQRIEEMVAKLRAQRQVDFATITSLEAELVEIRSSMKILQVDLDDCIARGRRYGRP